MLVDYIVTANEVMDRAFGAEEKKSSSGGKVRKATQADWDMLAGG